MIILTWTLNLKCVMYKCFFFLSFRCGDSIVVLNESLKHIELAAKLARVSVEHMCCVCMSGGSTKLALIMYGIIIEKLISCTP